MSFVKSASLGAARSLRVGRTPPRLLKGGSGQGVFLIHPRNRHFCFPLYREDPAKLARVFESFDSRNFGRTPRP